VSQTKKLVAGKAGIVRISLDSV